MALSGLLPVSMTQALPLASPPQPALPLAMSEHLALASIVQKGWHVLTHLILSITPRGSAAITTDTISEEETAS